MWPGFSNVKAAVREHHSKKSSTVCFDWDLMAANRPSRKPFIVKPRKLGLPAGFTYDNVEQMIERLEGPEHR